MHLPKQGMGTALTNFLKARIVGGLLFLLPVALVLIVLRRAMQVAGKVAQPISALLPDALAGAVVATGIAVLLLVLVSFLAGLVARTNSGRRTMRLFENSLLGGIPQYQLVKGMAEGLAQVENAEGVKPALVSIEGGWQIGIPTRAARERLGYRVSAAGAYSDVGHSDVPARGPSSPLGHPDGQSHFDRETHRRRVRRGAA